MSSLEEQRAEFVARRETRIQKRHRGSLADDPMANHTLDGPFLIFFDDN